MHEQGLPRAVSRADLHAARVPAARAGLDGAQGVRAWWQPR